MITNINYNSNNIKFINGAGETITFNQPSSCRSIVSFLQVEDGIILVLNWDDWNKWNKRASLGQRRGNVIKVDENGKIVWTCGDKLNVLKRKLLDILFFLRIENGSRFDRIHTENEKIILREESSFLYLLDPATGAIEYWVTGATRPKKWWQDTRY